MGEERLKQRPCLRASGYAGGLQAYGASSYGVWDPERLVVELFGGMDREGDPRCTSRWKEGRSGWAGLDRSCLAETVAGGGITGRERRDLHLARSQPITVRGSLSVTAGTASDRISRAPSTAVCGPDSLSGKSARFCSASPSLLALRVRSPSSVRAPQRLLTPMATPVSGAQSPADSNHAAPYDVDEEGTQSPRRVRARLAKRTIVSDDSDDEPVGTPSSSTRRQRGRPRVSAPQPKVERISASVVPADAIQEPIQIEDDETVLAHVDEDGERKVDENGVLFGDRHYRVRTFTILGRGQRLYMLSTEPARCMGYRDSYLFFLRHKTLHRIILDENEKDDLAERELIPNGYRTRQIAVCTARSVFREFGARIVIGGRRITDDYWEKEYQRLGHQEGVLADPDDRLPPAGVEYNRNQFVAWHGASNVYHQQPHTERRATRRVPAIDDVNWITAHAQAASVYNAELGEFRKRMLDGVQEAHTAQEVFPGISQPERVVWHEVLDGSIDCRNQRVVDVAMVVRSMMGGPGGLIDIDVSTFDVSPSVEAAIREQQRLEIADREFLATSLRTSGKLES